MLRKLLVLRTLVLLALVPLGCDEDAKYPPIVVNSLEDVGGFGGATVTLRSAVERAKSGQPIMFDASLDGAAIGLTIVGEEHTVLPGEVMGMRDEGSGPVSYLVGWFERDYGRSALYARKKVVIDASDLPNGITLAWMGGSEDPARVLAVYGSLTLKNVTITGGRVVAEDISSPDDPGGQPWTLARGGGLAVWGVARLSECTIHDNHVEGDFDPSRDRGAFGGGVYANVVEMERCVVSGNSVLGGGAAGGGVFSVGGAHSARDGSTIVDSSITGNRISGLFTYGGGVYSDGGGIGNRKRLWLTNTTIARNLVETPPGLPPFALGMGYWRGGGVYVSNGFLTVKGCTIVENEVHGASRTDDLGKPNMAGGIAATIGNAHAIETFTVGHSIVAGNTVHEMFGDTYEQDVFTGSTFYFRSLGHNRIGAIDFSQMLVPVGVEGWNSLSRRHYPKVDDSDGVAIGDVLDLGAGVARSASVLSIGTDASEPTVLHYQPRGSALDRISATQYVIEEVYGHYSIGRGRADDFLSIVLSRLESHYGLPDFADDFTASFEDFLQSVDLDEGMDGLQPYRDPSGDPILTLADTHWFGPAQTWPRELPNHPYIHFWHQLDDALLAEDIPGMGPEVLGDDAWAALFTSGRLFENLGIVMEMVEDYEVGVNPLTTDQLGAARPENGLGDIGAIEIP
ncbi:MAG: hypothetical protein JRH19_21400 [Deltaproteobacteria bacterium]|nr:hypothetical protein [Deltaproteobacteria bacterium]